MNRDRLALSIYLLGVALMVGITIYGKLLQPELNARGVAGMEATYGAVGLAMVLVFAFGFPLGIGLTYTGAVMFAPARRRAGLFALLALIGTVSALLIHLIFGTHTSAWFFGTGGVTILILVALSAWWWGQYRARLDDAALATADLQGAGYLCFAIAAWNLCGVGAMPGFALYPESVLSLNSRSFAVGQMKVVMAFLVLGWLLTALSLRRAAHGRR